MKKLLALSALAFAVPAQSAIVVSFQNGASVLPAGTTIFQNFNSLATGSSIGSNAFVYNSDISGIAARPAFGSTGNYGAVRGDPTGTYNVAFGTAVSIFSFALGSLDTYNRLTLILDSGPNLVLNGAQINQGIIADGNQLNGLTNGRVTYTVTGGGPNIIGATFQSIGQNSFEFDDLAVAAIPEPSTWLMMLMGFAAVGFGMRRRNAQGTLAVA